MAGLAIDLLVLAVWLEIDSEAYGKVAGVAFVWTFFGLIALGLTLAVGAPAELARALYAARARDDRSGGANLDLAGRHRRQRARKSGRRARRRRPAARAGASFVAARRPLVRGALAASRLERTKPS